MNSDDRILSALNRIQATLEIAFSAQIHGRRDMVRSDKLSAAILDLTTEWISSAELQDALEKRLKTNADSIRDRLCTLTAKRLIEMRGPEKHPEYRSAGVI